MQIRFDDEAIESLAEVLEVLDGRVIRWKGGYWMLSSADASDTGKASVTHILLPHLSRGYTKTLDVDDVVPFTVI